MKRNPLFILVWLGITCVALTQSIAPAQAPAADASKPLAQEKDIEGRVDGLLQKMTLEEKIELLSGRRGFYTLGIDRLGIPALKMADGPMGVRNYGPSTAFPAGIALAATWDTEMAQHVGAAMAQDARARGVNILLGPAVNIYRVPVDGRNFEYFGEDPYLAGQTAVFFIQGVQSQGVIATVKHFALNNQEYQRNTISAEVDERTMQEIYLPAFKAAMQQGKVWAVMSSYNKINGTYATANELLETQILKKDWGFRGIVMSDWGAAHDGIADALAGLDLEMPSGKYMNRETLLPAVRSGQVPESVIDDKVRRILRAAISMGFLDAPPVPAEPPKPLYSGTSNQVALAGARESIVLLKNSNHTLPLDRKTIHSIAVFGPNAHPAVDVGGGSARVVAFRDTSVLEALAETGLRMDYIPFQARDARSVAARSQFEADEAGAAGLNGEYFANADLSGTPLRTRRDRQITFAQFNDVFSQATPGGYSVRWTGFIAPDESGDHLLLVRTGQGIRLVVDGKTVVDAWDNKTSSDLTTTVHLEKGHAVPIRLEIHSTGAGGGGGRGGGGGAGGGIQFGWQMKPADTFPAETALAAKADAAVVCVGFNPDTESEGFDRTFDLPPGQKELIEAVARANKRTIVVINSGGAAEMSGWDDQAGAVLEAWYTGQESGQALADIIFGVANPSGKLPASFERHWGDSSADTNYPGSEGKVFYKEGIFTGYRQFDRSDVKPLFPFGYGLSYTTFAYSGIHTEKQGANVRVYFSIKNTGTRSGAEIAEVYVQEVNPKVPRPLKELKGFARVTLAPGAVKNVHADLDRAAFSYYDVASHGWKVDPGEFRILVGSSSADIRLTAPITIQ
ncbi:MAG TPA: glycoside hydrolase family 3 C-terminal domain-containing protein [Candidatus Acidoferrales bacterium]|jgi:beta-glucosidase|nr:glycoside hydrolase family 3 C-terminal domain-containing protein [Candidatus Acidoferrales bacterium]